MRRGQILCERYKDNYTRDTLHALFSGAKGLNSLMVAAAAVDGMLSLDELVADTLTEWKGDSLKGRLIIRQLLSFASGLMKTGPRAASGCAEAAATPAQYPPGSR